MLSDQGLIPGMGRANTGNRAYPSSNKTSTRNQNMAYVVHFVETSYPGLIYMAKQKDMLWHPKKKI
jgi:hypothetical protein